MKVGEYYEDVGDGEVLKVLKLTEGPLTLCKMIESNYPEPTWGQVGAKRTIRLKEYIISGNFKLAEKYQSPVYCALMEVEE